ncbi:L10-interacting MYB domain-containing protein-like [Zea mays]|uniref:L10-interacting MYB domain-containing protein-like n=1 Tax=Zea mays TaxID=4577 RepID=UPI0004DE983B|nr:L10-interacting MYB domain-containing protein-like [Zea mays]|eukprot:XP_008660387.1 L10-interacting MYB domain-containing protein-like [Zea mays]
MSDSADWNEDNTALVCELFAEQVKAHNRSGTHLNKTGYKNVMDKFKEKTGLSYTKMQFKNKWDKMRIEYTNWKRLLKETGLGWDTTKKTWSATNERWKNLNKQYKGIAKFKDGPLLHEEEKPSCMKILGTHEMIIGLSLVVLHHKFWRVKPLRTPMTRMETMRLMMTRMKTMKNVKRFHLQLLKESVIFWILCRASFMQFMD